MSGPAFVEASALLPDTASWVLFFTCAVLIGMSKTGVQNIGTMTVPLFALLFGAKYSTGIVLIMLCLADLMAVIYYRKQLKWAEVLRILPSALVGLAVGLVLGEYLDENYFKIVMAGCIFVGLGIMLWGGRLHTDKLEQMTQTRWYSPLFGFVAGFSTMIGNAAGPALSIYLLTKRFDRFTFVAVGAWFIMILNYIKIPLQAFIWKNLTIPGVLLSLSSLPFIVLGGIIGINIIKHLNDRYFRKLVTFLVFVSSIILLVV